MVPLEYDAGTLPCINGHIIQDIDHYPIGNSNNARISFRGRNSWCITNGLECLNKKGEWEPEPLPSNRTEDFCERTRFQTPEQAYGYYVKWRVDFIHEWKRKGEEK